jgi:ferredoxin--NADP+ reductase
MKIFTEKFLILEKYPLAPKIHYVLVNAPLIAKKSLPGQFVIVRITEKGERIPLTIADYDRKQGSIVIVFQEIGKTTSDFAKLKAGDELLDLLGPQGTPTETDPEIVGKNVVVIGGGIGIAPTFPLARSLKEKNVNVTSIIGFRSKEYVFWEEKIRSVSNNLIITTNDGSYGKKGFVTDALKELIDNKTSIDHIFAIGPAIMMKSVCEISKNFNIPTTVSLNSLMVCGMGMCGACRITVGEEIKFTCMDGPDFDGAKVNFDELIKRLDTYKKEECECCKTN